MSDEAPIQGSNVLDVIREMIRAVRDILNDWRVATALLVLVLLFFVKIEGNQLMEGVEGWIRAWRCGQ